MPAIKVDHYEVFGLQHALVHAGGSSQNAPIGKAHRQIAFTCDDVAALIQPPTHQAYLAAVLLFILVIAKRNRVRAHRTDSFLGKALSTAPSFLQPIISCGRLARTKPPPTSCLPG